MGRAKVTHVYQFDRGRRLCRLPRISERRDRVAGLSARKFEVHGTLDVGRLEGVRCGVFRCFDDSTLTVQGSTLELLKLTGDREEVGTEALVKHQNVQDTGEPEQ